MLPKDLTQDSKNRLNYLSGQINGIVRMLNEHVEPEAILNLFKTVDQGLEKAEEKNKE